MAEEDTAAAWPLHQACRVSTSVESVRKCLQSAPNALSQKDTGGKLPLHLTCTNQSSAAQAIVQIVLGGNPGAAQQQDDAGECPLYNACQESSSVDVVQMLIVAYPAALQLKNSDGQLPLHAACINKTGGAAAIVELLQARLDAQLLALFDENPNVASGSSKKKNRKKKSRAKKQVVDGGAAPAESCLPPAIVMQPASPEGFASQKGASAALEAALSGDQKHGELSVLLDTHASSADPHMARNVSKRMKDKERKMKMKASKVRRCIDELAAAMGAGTDTARLIDAIEAGEAVLRSPAAAGSGLEQMLQAAKQRLEVAKIECRAAEKAAALETIEEEFVALAISDCAPAEEDLEANVEDLDKLCVICLEKEKEMCLVPCGHRCVCKGCSDVLAARDNLCPVCRAVVVTRCKVFL